LAGIVEEESAFAFNVECAEILLQSEMDAETEREKRMIEMITGGQVMNALGAPQSSRQSSAPSRVERW
jgi:hypothetical protein